MAGLGGTFSCGCFDCAKTAFAGPAEAAQGGVLAEPISPATSARFPHLAPFEGSLVLGGPGLQVVLAGVPAAISTDPWQGGVQAVFLRREGAGGAWERSAALTSLELANRSVPGGFQAAQADFGVDEENHVAYATFVETSPDGSARQVVTWQLDPAAGRLAALFTDEPPAGRTGGHAGAWELRLRGAGRALSGAGYLMRSRGPDVFALLGYRPLTTTPLGDEELLAAPAGAGAGKRAAAGAPPVEGFELLLTRAAAAGVLAREASLKDCLYGVQRPRKVLKDEAKLPWILGCDAEAPKAELRLSVVGAGPDDLVPIYLFDANGEAVLSLPIGVEPLTVTVQPGVAYSLADTPFGRIVPGSQPVTLAAGTTRAEVVPAPPPGALRLLPAEDRTPAVLAATRLDDDGDELQAVRPGAALTPLGPRLWLIRRWPADLAAPSGGYDVGLARARDGRFCGGRTILHADRRAVIDCASPAQSTAVAEEISEGEVVVDTAVAAALTPHPAVAKAQAHRKGRAARRKAAGAASPAAQKESGAPAASGQPGADAPGAAGERLAPAAPKDEPAFSKESGAPAASGQPGADAPGAAGERLAPAGQREHPEFSPASVAGDAPGAAGERAVLTPAADPWRTATFADLAAFTAPGRALDPSLVGDFASAVGAAVVALPVASAADADRGAADQGGKGQAKTGVPKAGAAPAAVAAKTKASQAGPIGLPALVVADAAAGASLTFLPATPELAARWAAVDAQAPADRLGRFVQFLRDEGAAGFTELGCPAPGLAADDYARLALRLAPTAVRIVGCPGFAPGPELWALRPDGADRPLLVSAASLVSAAGDLDALFFPRLALAPWGEGAPSGAPAARAARVAEALAGGAWSVSAGALLALQDIKDAAPAAGKDRAKPARLAATLAMSLAPGVRPRAVTLYTENGLLARLPLGDAAGTTLAVPLPALANATWLRAELRGVAPLLAPGRGQRPRADQLLAATNFARIDALRQAATRRARPGAEDRP